ncbi:MAG: hypothetical protein EOO73_33180 [Myxococcales bacterium]|nr:MAG: hypothetical protein EOO73_33180 [Myxococcales bacterium]
MLWRGVGSILGAAGSLFLAAACGNGGDSRVGPTSGANAGASASGGKGSGPDLGNVTGGSAAAGGSGRGQDCAADLVEAQRFPLDMYVMLDVSGSMLTPTEGDADISKWQAVSSALADFVSDPASAGMGVGLQVFPLRHPEAPASCTSNAQCAGFESCLLRVCWNTNDLRACESDEDCGVFADAGSCVSFGVCEGDAGYVCPTVGVGCGTGDNGEELGDCVAAPPSQCTLTADCRPASYAAPAAEIASLPGAGAALVASLQASAPDPANLTPTGPALEGAILHAQSWAQSHPDHRVITVLATDGQPTLRTAAGACGRTEPADLQRVYDIAGQGRTGAPPISTFVVGVLGPEDAATGAATVLDRIAESGGTGQALIIDTQGDVQTKFRAALDTIRGQGLSCELKVPEGKAGKPVDYGQVNVELTSPDGKRQLLYVKEAAGCAAEPNGWYFDIQPEEGTPTRIVVCPSVCTTFQSLDEGSVAIALGCARQDVK